MIREKFNYKKWSVIYTPGDGARLDRLNYDGFDLLTTEPKDFKPPATDYGEYENRAVYGYDDCFPSVDPCKFPGENWMVPDHGELCWIPWKSNQSSNHLMFTVESHVIPVLFKRKIKFNENSLIWDFDLTNLGMKKLPFLYVTHPLMPLSEVETLEFPKFKSVYDSVGNQTLDLNNPAGVMEFLLTKEKGTATMLFLQNIENGEMRLRFKNGIDLEIKFPQEYFHSIGIWWNNSGYPDEDGSRRNECAFEPVPGLTSDLSRDHASGNCLFIKPGEKLSWQFEWIVTHR
jgi:hypothetical protein